MYALITLHFVNPHSGNSVRMKPETFHDGIKPVHITALDYEMHELYDAFSYSKHKPKVRTYYAASDYEMHD